MRKNKLYSRKENLGRGAGSWGTDRVGSDIGERRKGKKAWISVFSLDKKNFHKCLIISNITYKYKMLALNRICGVKLSGLLTLVSFIYCFPRAKICA